MPPDPRPSDYDNDRADPPRHPRSGDTPASPRRPGRNRWMDEEDARGPRRPGMPGPTVMLIVLGVIAALVGVSVVGLMAAGFRFGSG